MREVSSFQAWRRLMSYLRPYRKMALVAFIGIVASNGLQIAIPAILRDVVDIGIARRDATYMFAAGMLIIGLGVLRGITGFLYRYFGEKMSHKIAYDVRNEMYNHVQHLSFSYHNRTQTGNIITRAISDVDEMQRYFAFGLIDGLNTALLTTGVLVVMLISSPALTLLTIIPLIPLAILSKRFAQKIDPKWKEIMEQIQSLSAHLQENVIGAQVVRAFAREDYEIKKWSKQNEILFNKYTETFDYWSRYMSISQFLVAMTVSMVLVFGGLMERAAFGGVTIGVIVSFNAYVFLIGQPLRFLGFVIMLTTQAVASSKRVFEVLDAPYDIDSAPNALPLPAIRGHVKFEDVAFKYEDGVDHALRNINIEAQPGEIIALLGQTGSGKSTLVNLLPRFFDATGGKISIDGYDIREVDLFSLREQIGVVLQDSLLFSATIHDNIAYGRPNATREQVITAAKAANAHDFIMEFSEGYETEIGERGVTLSGGQRQRIAIARALLIDPRILILDDSTSSVDTRTEFLIQEALSHLMEGRTTFVIAQRLTTVKNANQILVLEDGEIVERGKHDDLLALDGLYAEIYRLQLADQERLKHELMALGGLLEENGNGEKPQFGKMTVGMSGMRGN